MSEMKNGSRLIFIGGSPRSGTTLVQNMLDSHPSILGGPEFLHLKNIMDLRKKLHYSISKGWIDIFCKHDDVDSHIITVINRLFLPLADRHLCDLYSEKTPENVLVFSELIELFPEAHFINVIRDPRAIVSSMQQVKNRSISKGKKPPPFTVNLSTSIKYIKQHFDAGFAASKNAPGKVLTVVYEHLLANPEQETKKICTFLGITWNDTMLRPGEKKHLGEQAITSNSNGIWYDSNSYNRNPASQNIDKWQSKLSLSKQLKTCLAFKDNSDLKKHGYDFSVDSITQVNRVLVKSYFFYLFLGLKIYRFFHLAARKVPGISLVR